MLGMDIIRIPEFLLHLDLDIMSSHKLYTLQILSTDNLNDKINNWNIENKHFLEKKTIMFGCV